VRIFKTKLLARFTRREGIDDASLNEAVERAGRGLVDADLGGGLFKQRVPRKGEGRRGGYRMLVAFRAGDRAIFVFGFAKSERENITDDELRIIREVADSWLAVNAGGITKALAEGLLIEVQYDG
jgi:hypothetical protein